jgi:hypothetical protein
MRQWLAIAIATSSTLLWAGCGGQTENDSSAHESGESAAVAQENAPEADHAASDAEQDALHKSDPTGTYGAGVHLKESIALTAIVDNPSEYEGRIVQVSGKVDEVCPRRGCWIDLADGEKTLRVKVTDGEIVFPLSAKGTEAVVEGIVEKIELDEEQHRAWKAHLAEEKGEEFDPESVSGPLTMWRIAGMGARIEG